MIAIIGGGLLGLTLAVELQKWCEPCTVFEQSEVTESCIQTINKEDFQLECPDWFFADPTIIDYLERLGFSEDSILIQDIGKNPFILKEKRHHLPAGPIQFLFSRLLSMQSKISVMTEFFTKHQSYEDETLYAFIEHRFSKETADYILTPLVNHIYGCHPSQLHLSLTLPFLRQYRIQHGSIIKGILKNNDLKRVKTAQFKLGAEKLSDRLAAKVKNLKTGYSVTNVEKTDTGYKVKTSSTSGNECFYFDSVVFCCSASAVANIIKEPFPSYATALQKIKYSQSVKVFIGFKAGSVSSKLSNVILLNAAKNGVINDIVCRTNSSADLPDNPDWLLTVTIKAGSSLEDEEILRTVRAELREMLNIQADPVFFHILRLENPIPGFEVSNELLEQYAKELESQSIYSGSSWLYRQSIPDTIKTAQRLAIKITENRAGIANKGCC